MSARSIPLQMLSTQHAAEDEATDQVFIRTAELFSALATPLRLRILSAICNQGKSVNAIVEAVDSTQPNVSQHLKMLYSAGIVAKRRVGNQMVYRVRSEDVLQLCRAAYTKIETELDAPKPSGHSTQWARPIKLPSQF
ncbi:putative HTH-type transcriptional regulator [mine drainage metagenome]|uniref:Putative HTH-type transcriptional regulator n=1 Tax=mine drainage metagenome TaxID=410659 RepID=A0A1J5R5T6_9ZZZZ